MMPIYLERLHCITLNYQGIILNVEDISPLNYTSYTPFFSDSSEDNSAFLLGKSPWSTLQTHHDHVVFWHFVPMSQDEWTGSMRLLPSWWEQIKEMKDILNTTPLVAWEKVNHWLSDLYPIGWGCRKEQHWFQKPYFENHLITHKTKSKYSISFYSEYKWLQTPDFEFFLQLFSESIFPVFELLDQLNHVFFSLQLDPDFRVVQVSENWFDYWGSHLIYQTLPSFIQGDGSADWERGGLFDLVVSPESKLSFLFHPAHELPQGHLKVLIQPCFFPFREPKSNQFIFHLVCSQSGKLLWFNEFSKSSFSLEESEEPIWDLLPPEERQPAFKGILDFAQTQPNREIYYQWHAPVKSDVDQLFVWQIKFDPNHAHFELWGNYQTPLFEFVESWQVFNEIYEPIFLANASPMWIYEPGTWRILDVNQAACSQYGYSRDEFRRLTLIDLRPPNRLSDLLLNPTKSYPQGQTDFGIYIHTKRNGSSFKTRVTGFPIQYQQSTYILATGHPIMEEALEKYSLALQMSEKKLQSAAQMAKLGYWELNLNTFELTWSREMYEVYEVEPSEFFPTHETFLQLIHRKDIDKVSEVWKGIDSGETEFDLIFQAISPSGKTRWIQDRSQYEFNSATQEKWLRGTSQDITSQRAEALKLALFEKIVESVEEAIFILQPDPLLGFKATYCNQSFTKLTGFTCQDFLGKNPLEGYQLNWSASQVDQVYSSLKHQTATQVTFLNARKTQEIYWSNLSFSPVPDNRDEQIFWVLTERDVTQQKNEALQWKMGAEISRYFSQTETLHEALVDTLDYLADVGRFDIAEFWFLDPTIEKLYLKAHVGRGELGQKFYNQSSLVLQFNYGEGLPGHVWRSGKTEFWKIGEKMAEFPRIRAANQAGLQEVWGIPIRHQKRMIGVLLVGRGMQLGFQELTHQVLVQMEWLLGAEITRKQMETQLLELFTFSPDLLGILGPNGRIRNINPSFAQTFGYTFDELVGKDLSVILDQNPRTEEWIQDVSGQKPAVLAKSITKLGEEKWISWTKSYTGEPEEYRFIYGRDITAQVHARQELERKTKQLNVLSETNSALLQETNWMEPMYKGMKWMAEAIQVDRVSFYSLENTKAHLKLEWCKPEIPKRYKTGSWISEELVEYPKLLIKMHQGQMITQDQGPSDDYLFSSPAYLILPILVNAKAWGFWIFESIHEPHEWDLDEYSFLGTLSQNFTKAIESQHHKGILIDTLREKELILQSISDGFVVIDEYFKWQYLNRTAEKLLQIEATKWKGKSVISTLPFSPDPKLVQIILDSIKTKETASFEVFYPPTQLWFDIKIYPTGKGITIYFQDITDRKVQQETLAKMNTSLARSNHDLQILNDELEQFAFIASHDLQEPLRMITSFMQLLERRYGDQLDDRAKQYIQFASGGAKRMKQIITDLLHYSRVGKQVENVEELDLTELIEDYKLLRKKLIQEHQVEIELTSSTRFKFYRSPIVQVFHCLLDNALRYIAPDRRPQVTVWMEESPDSWKFFIQDNGIGIDSAYFDKIFIMFQRLHDRETYEGTGMGLAIVKKQVESWGGHVSVSSTLKIGSTFQFTVPKL